MIGQTLSQYMNARLPYLQNLVLLTLTLGYTKGPVGLCCCVSGKRISGWDEVTSVALRIWLLRK